MYLSGQCPTGVAPDGITPVQLPCPEAWGAFLGTCMLCSLIEILLAFLPARIMKNLFPPVVTGVTVFLIGAKLIGTGLTQWAGGAGPCSAMPIDGFFSVCPNLGAPNAAPWGSPQWIGLGFLVFMTIMFVEFFGSPFMRNAQVVIGLVVGLIVAAATGYTDRSTLDSAPTVTFLWVKNFSTFPLSIYAPAIIPLLVTYVLTMVEAIGDVTASCEVSRLAVEGREFESRIQGGVLADGLGGFLSAVMTNSPMSVFAQNNGIIALTRYGHGNFLRNRSNAVFVMLSAHCKLIHRCANAAAGYMCCVFLILMGVFSKFGTLFLMIPDSVLGGMTTFLFANVATSGIRILAFLRWTRRDRFIVSAAISLGLGVSLIPNALTHFVSYQGTSSALQGLVDSVNIILSTGFCVGAIIAIILNQLLPEEMPEEEIEEGVQKADSQQSTKSAAEMEEATSGEKADMKHL
jgi:xanthine/uracil permease